VKQRQGEFDVLRNLHPRLPLLVYSLHFSTVEIPASIKGETR
jgi:hypothetical protein